MRFNKRGPRFGDDMETYSLLVDLQVVLVGGVSLLSTMDVEILDIQVDEPKWFLSGKVEGNLKGDGPRPVRKS